ncbi:MAG: TadE/TadG family type IV pilus assembly protein [Rhodoluna sp.]|jgi:hypothetical protein
MRFLKSLSFELWRESGSAVVEFVLVVLPCSLMILIIQGLFGFASALQVSQQQTYELARYAALADVTVREIDSNVAANAPGAEIQRVIDDSGCFYFARRVRNFDIWGWPFPIEVHLEAKVTCEV